MKTKQLNCHYDLKAAMFRARIIVAAVFFAILVNIVNLGAFYKGSIADLGALPLQAQSSDISKVFNALNIPVKIVGNLFNGFHSGQKKQDKEAANEKYAVIANPAKRPGIEFVKRDLFFPVSESKSLVVPPVDTSPDISLLNLFCLNGFIMILMLILMLISVLPRGISFKNNKIYIFYCPVFI